MVGGGAKNCKTLQAIITVYNQRKILRMFDRCEFFVKELIFNTVDVLKE